MKTFNGTTRLISDATRCAELQQYQEEAAKSFIIL